MALYIAARGRRRRTVLIALATAAAGLLIGFIGGRTTAPTAADKIRSVQEDARQTAAGLRVISLHDEAGAVSSSGSSDGGTQLVLDRTKQALTDEFDRAIWITDGSRSNLLRELDRLTARTDRSTAAFGKAADTLATHIEQTFGTDS